MKINWRPDIGRTMYAISLEIFRQKLWDVQCTQEIPAVVAVAAVAVLNVVK